MDRIHLVHVGPLTQDRINGISISAFSQIRNQRMHSDVAAVSAVSTLMATRSRRDGQDLWGYKDISHVIATEGSGAHHVGILHGIYGQRLLSVSKEFSRRGLSYVVVPHGGLVRALRTRGRIQKTIYDLLVVRRLVCGASAIHFLSAEEASNSLSFGKSYFAVGNGVDIPDQPLSPSGHRARKFVYMGRIDIHHKGLDLLVEGIRIVKDEFAALGASLKLVGPGHKNDRQILQRKINSAGLRGLVVIEDAVSGEGKWEVLRDADVFVHTSRYEGQPQAVLEALSVGLPVLCTPGTNLLHVVNRPGMGWAVREDSTEIGNAIIRIARDWRDDDSLAALRRDLIRAEFSWPANAFQAVEYIKASARGGHGLSNC